MPFSTSETKWMKFGKSHDFVFVGKDTIATASGIYVSFLDLSTRERRIERFDTKERGDGASCLAGHPVVSMFSVVERKPNPKISIFMYPTLRRISICMLPDKINGYLSCSFAGTEYLISLTSFPDFRLIIWLWKTGKHVAVLNTKIDNLIQEICCSSNPPCLISQLGVVDGTLSIYQVRTCSKIVSIHHMDVPLPTHKIVSASWTPEGNLFVSDEFGNVRLVVIDANKIYSVIKSEIRELPKNKPIVVTHKNGVIVVNTDSEITFYKKSSADWNVSWQFTWSISTISHPIWAAKQHYCKDKILFHSKNGEIFEISTQHDNIPRIEVIYTDDIEYKALFSISLRTDHVAAVDRLDRLCIFELSTGRLIARLSLKHHGEVLHIDAHPILSILVSCSSAGNCIFIDITDVSLSKIINCLHLHGDPLNRIRFSLCGELLAIANSYIGKIFVVTKQLKQQRMNVLGLIEVGGHITDFLLYRKNNERFKILVLITTNSSIASSVGGNKVIVYDCENNFCARAVCMIDLSRSFRMLYYGSTKPLSILGVPSLSKQLYQMEIQDDCQDIILTAVIFSMHQMQNIGMHVTDSQVITYGYDGLVIIRDSTELRKVIAIFMLHHRSEGGIKSAVLSRFGEMIISLGRNGDLVASRIRLPETRANFVRTETANVCLSTQDFASGTTSFCDLEEETWLDSVTTAQMKAEHDKTLPAQISIVNDLKKIKNQIRELLDINENASSDVRLAISAFDLDHESRQRKIEEARRKRDESCRNLEEECAQRDQIASYLCKIFWAPLEIKPCALRSIDGKQVIRIQNYPLVACNQKRNNVKVWDKLSSDADEFLYSYEVYDESINEEDNSKQMPTVGFDKEHLMANINKSKIHEIAKIWYTSADKTEKLCVSGVTTHRWIEDESSILIHQLVSCDYDFETILKKDAIIESREHKLKMHFNNLFEEMRCLKEHELIRARKRIDRLQYCASELKTLFGINSILEPIEIPMWNIEEISDYVITMKNYKIFEKQSMPCENSVAKKINENREDEKKDEKDNDFHIKALEDMMGGVLESTWEDEVKKEVPIPECLITKNPSRYTNEDIAVIAAYKLKIQALQEEREKYKTVLQTEIIETREALRRDIAAFNGKLKDLELKKLQIECAILQERLMRIRTVRRHRAEIDGKEKMVRFADEELAPAMREIRKLTEECNSLEVVVLELKARYDNLCKAEKRHEAKFFSEFADLKQPIMEHLLRHYKKRPKAGRLTSTSVTYLIEVAKCVISGEKSEILPRECLDFLRAMDALDTMLGNLPSQINVNHWRMMCKLRRAKIEIEIKVRCCAVEIAEAEQTLSFYQKTMQSAGNTVACKKIKLDDMKQTLARLAEEMEIQLILKMGQIEIPLRGCPSDYANTILVAREELLRVNDCIIETGKRKLVAMHKSMHLRKVVSQHEWQHACAKMVLNDLQQELKDVQQFRITRNVLGFLIDCSHGIDLEKDYEKMQAHLRAFQSKFRELLKLEQTRLKKIRRLLAKWKKKNDKLSKEVRSKSADVEEYRRSLNDPCRKKNEESRKKRFAAIAKRTRLIMKVEDNYEQLLTLHARLEVLKLRTYPTLRFKTA